MKHRNGDKVASQDDHIWMKLTDDFDRRGYRRHRVFVVVEIAELHNGEAVESRRQSLQHDFNRGQDGVLRLKNYAVIGQGERAGRATPAAI